MGLSGGNDPWINHCYHRVCSSAFEVFEFKLETRKLSNFYCKKTGKCFHWGQRRKMLTWWPNCYSRCARKRNFSVHWYFASISKILMSEEIKLKWWWKRSLTRYIQLRGTQVQVVIDGENKKKQQLNKKCNDGGKVFKVNCRQIEVRSQCNQFQENYLTIGDELVC